MTDQADNDTPLTDDTVDPRHLRRIEVMQVLFAYSFRADRPDESFTADFLNTHPEFADILKQLPAIDQRIQSLAAERPLSDINKVDLAILRSIVLEWNSKRTPKKVLIDEAVELAKEFGTESSPKFVNGVLAQLFKQEQATEEE